MQWEEVGQFLQQYPNAWIAGAIVIGCMILAWRPVRLIDTDNMIRNSFTVPLLMLVLGIFLAVWGFIGWINTYRLSPGSPPTLTQMQEDYKTLHSTTGKGYVYLDAEHRQDPKTKEWMAAWERTHNENYNATVTKYNERYGSFEYPPVALAIPAIICGIALALCGGIFLNDYYNAVPAEKRVEDA